MMSLFRKLTDRPVYCRKCGGIFGYVWLFGHKRWEHESCSAALAVKAV